MNISLSDHFSYKKLILFSLPNIFTMLVMASYDIVDGYFISNFVGAIPFAAVNLFFPIVILIFSFGFMFGTGGAALVSFTQGEGKSDTANEYFTMMIQGLLFMSVLCCLLVYIFLPSLIRLAGAQGELIDLCIEYGHILILFSPFYTVGQAFATFLITAEKPEFTFYIALFTACFNAFFDYLFIVHFHWGLTGAALATGLSWTISSVLPLIYFLSKNSSTLRLVSCRMNLRVILKGCSNGIGDIIAVTCIAFISVLINYRLLHLFGEDGIIAFGVVSYTAGVASAISAGYAFAITSVVGYHAGAKNYTELKSILRKSAVITLSFGSFLAFLVYTVADFFSALFISNNDNLCLMSQDALKKTSLTFLFFTFNIFGPPFFAGLNKGKISAVISTFQNLIFPTITIFSLPFFFGRDAIWFVFVATDFGAFLFLLLCYYSTRETFCGSRQ